MVLGQRQDMTAALYTHSDADISPDGRYRYRLWRALSNGAMR